MNNPDTTPEPHWTDRVGEVLVVMGIALMLSVFVYVKLGGVDGDLTFLAQNLVQDTALDPQVQR